MMMEPMVDTSHYLLKLNETDNCDLLQFTTLISPSFGMQQ